MMYYPGCTVKTTAQSYEKVAIGVLKLFGINVIEMNRWVCCGVYPGLARDVVYHLVAPIRNLIYAQEEIKERGLQNNYLLTLCSMCFNTLRSANSKYINDEELRSKLDYFFQNESYYEGKIKVVHFLEVLRDIVGFKELSKKIEKKLRGIGIAAFYGCYLLRPRGIGIDDPDSPRVMEDLIALLGGKPVIYPYRNRCCGGYLVVKEPEMVWNRIKTIVKSAIYHGAKILVTTCPLCAYNLEEGQKRFKDEIKTILPVFFEPELIAYALNERDLLEPEKLEILDKMLK